MNRKLTLASLAAATIGIFGSFVFLTHTSATANTSSGVKQEVALPKGTSEHILPGGASSLNETYQDWRLLCRQTDAGSRCAISQQEFDGKTRQRILSMELAPTSGQMSGVIVLPFGVALNKGASIEADGKVVGSRVNFSTCVPGGCLVPVNFDRTQLASIQNGKKIEVKFSSVAGQQIALPISNKGLDKAVDRIMALSR